jgi:hypothetical protein
MGIAKRVKDMENESMAGSDYDNADSASSFSKPSMSPPPYLETHVDNPSSFKAVLNTTLNGPAAPLFRLTFRLIQIAFALASGVSYAIELDHRYSASTTNFIYAEVIFGFTLLTLVIDCVTLRYYRYIWAIEWTLTVLWIACFGVFYGVYLNGKPPADYAVVNNGRMKLASWCNLVNAILWLGSALCSSVVCCSGIRANSKGKRDKGRQRKGSEKVSNEIGQMEASTIAEGQA